MAIIDVDDQGTLKVQNFKDALVDLGATVRKTNQGIPPVAPQVKDALTQLIEQSRAAAIQVAKNATGFSILNDQLRVGTTVTKQQADAYAQIAAQTATNQKFVAQFGTTLSSLNSTMTQGTTITKAQAAQLQVLSQGYQQTTTSSASTTSSLQSFNASALAVATTLGIVTYNAAGLLKESGMLAGRVETLGIVMDTMAKRSTVSSLEMQAQAEATRRLGITTQEARSAVIQFAQAQIDVTKTSELARAAQDLAVVAGENSSQTFQRLTTAIQIQQPMLLRQVGIISGLQQIYSEYARELGKTWRELDETEKRQAFLNKILNEAQKVTGAYEASMESAFKQIGSFARVVEEAKVKLGEALLPAMLLAVEIATRFLTAWTNLTPAVQAFVTSLLVATTAVATFVAAFAGAQFLGIVGVVVKITEAFTYFFIGLRAGMPILLAATSAFGGLTLAMGGIVVALALVAAAYVYLTGTAKAATVELDNHAASVLADINALEKSRASYNSAFKAVTALGEEYTKLSTKAKLSREEQDRLAFVTQELAFQKDKLHRANDSLIKQAPGLTNAIGTETVAQQLLNDAIDMTIEKRRQELAALLPGKQDQINDAEAALKAATQQKEAALKVREANMAVLEQYKAQAAAGVQIIEQRRAQASADGRQIETHRDLATVLQESAALQKKLNAEHDEAAKVAVGAAAQLKGLRAEFDQINRAVNPEVLAKFNDNLKSIDIEKAREDFKEMGTTLSAALKRIGKDVDDLYDQKMSPSRVREILAQATTAWNKHADDVKRAQLQAEKAAQQLYDTIVGDNVRLAENLKVVNRALGEVTRGSDDYVSRLLRAREVIKSASTLTADQTKEFKNLQAAQDDLMKIDLVERFEKYRDKAREVVDAFQQLASEGVRHLADSFRTLNEQADETMLDQQRDFAEQMLDIDRDLYERSVLGKQSEVDQKIFQNNRYYQDQVRQLDKQIRLLERETQAEKEAIREQTVAQLNALDDAQRRAELRFEIEVSTETAIQKAKKALADTAGKTPAQVEAEVQAIADDLHAALDSISQNATQVILGLQREALKAAQGRATIRQQEVEDIRRQQGKIVAVNEQTNEDIRKQHDLTRQALALVASATVSAFTDGLASALLRTKTWKEAMIDVFQSLRRALFSLIDSIVQKWTQGLAQVIMGQGSGQGGFVRQVAQAAGFVGGGGGGAAGTAGAGGGAATGGITMGTLATVGAIAGSAGAGIALERLGEKWFGGPGGKATTFGSIAGAGAGFAIGVQVGSVGGPLGAVVGGLAGTAYGVYRSRQNDARKARDEFLKDLGFDSLEELRDTLMAGGVSVDRAQELFNRAANVIGRHDLEGNKKWMEEIVLALKKIETSKAWDALVKSVGSADQLRKQMSLVGLSFDALEFSVLAGDVEAVKTQMEGLNKALEEQQKRLGGLQQAAAGLGQMTEGWAARVKRSVDDVMKGLSDQERTTFQGAFGAAKDKGFEGSEASFLLQSARVFKGDFSEETLGKIAELTKRAQIEFTTLGQVATATFAGILADTGDIVQAFNAIAPSLSTMRELQKELGLEATGAFDKLLRFGEVVEKNQDVANSLSGIQQVLTGLSTSGGITQELFNSLGQNASDLFDVLTERGVDADSKLMLMQPTLQALWEAQKKFGFETDEATQKLIDMGLEHGLVGDKMQDVNHQILDVLLLIADALGAKLPKAYQDSKKAAEDSARDQANAADRARTHMEDYRRTIDDTRLAWQGLGDEAEQQGRDAEDAATRAAEGSSPTGMKQLVYRLNEARALFRSLRDAAVIDMRTIEAAAATTADRGAGQLTPEALGIAPAPRTVETPAPGPATIQVTVQHNPSNTFALSALDGADMEAVVRDRIAPQLVAQSQQNANQLAVELSRALTKHGATT